MGRVYQEYLLECRDLSSDIVKSSNLVVVVEGRGKGGGEGIIVNRINITSISHQHYISFLPNTIHHMLLTTHQQYHQQQLNSWTTSSTLSSTPPTNLVVSNFLLIPPSLPSSPLGADLWERSELLVWPFLLVGRGDVRLRRGEGLVGVAEERGRGSRGEISQSSSLVFLECERALVRWRLLHSSMTVAFRASIGEGVASLSGRVARDGRLP